MRFPVNARFRRGYSNAVRSLRLCLILLFVGAMAIGAESKGPAVAKVTRSKVDVGMTCEYVRVLCVAKG